MEIMSKHVMENERIDMHNEELKDIIKAVDVLMNRFVKSMQEEFPQIQVDHLRLCGSMAEKTRLWSSVDKQPNSGGKLEFDYLAVLKSWPNCGELRFKHSETCTGLMTIEYEIHDKESATGKTSFLSNSIKDAFIFNFLASVDLRCKRNFCPQYGYIRTTGSCGRRTQAYDHEIGCSFCTVYVESGNLRMGSSINVSHEKLCFVWTPKLYSIESEKASNNADDYEYQLKYIAQNIDIDFHPVISMEGKRSISSKEDIAVETKDTPLFLFPKKCDQHKYWENRCRNMVWRISTHTIELLKITETSLEHRLGYMILKYLVIKFLSSNDERFFKDFSFYDLKSVFLHHIGKCHSPNKGTASCLIDMLNMLKSFYENACLPHFLLHFNLLEVRYDKENYQEMGHLFGTLKDILSISNAHLDLKDVIRDVTAIRIIIQQYRSYVYYPCTWFDDRNEIQEETIRLLSHSLQKFVASRRISSAEDTLKDTAVKYICVMENSWKLIQSAFQFHWQIIDMNYIERLKYDIDKHYHKIDRVNSKRYHKIDRENSDSNYFNDMMNETWLLGCSIEANECSNTDDM